MGSPTIPTNGKKMLGDFKIIVGHVNFYPSIRQKSLHMWTPHLDFHQHLTLWNDSATQLIPHLER